MRISVLFCFIAIAASAIGQTRYLKKVNKFLDRGDTARAVVQLNKMISKHEGSADLYMKRAELKIIKGDLGPALIDLNSFCTYNQTCGEALYMKGVICYRQENYRGAIAHLSDYSRKHYDPNGWMYLGLCHLNLGNHEIAANAFSKATTKDPENFEAQYNAGLASYKYGNYKAAVDYFTKPSNLLPASADAWVGLGLALNAVSEFESSNKALRQAIAIIPDHGGALYNIGVNYHGLDQFELACTYWNRAKEAQNQAAVVALERYCSETASKAH